MEAQETLEITKYFESFPEEIKMLHLELNKHYSKYICFHPGFYYHVLIHHDHETADYADYILILDHASSEPAEIRLYHPVGNEPTRYVCSLEWHDPELLAKIHAHLDRYLPIKRE